MASQHIYQYPEQHRFAPFHVFGELYYIGDDDVCAYLLDTGAGLILIDTGYPTGQAGIVDSIWRLGYDPKNIRIILHTHGHFDHFGCTRFLKEVSGAKTYLSVEDSRMFRERPELIEADMAEGFCHVEPFEPDVELRDGDVIHLGSVTIRVMETPGHTDGVLTFFIELHSGEEWRTAALFGGIGRNTMRQEYACRRHVSGYREKFRESLKRLRGTRADITLANHVNQGPLMQNYKDDCGFVHPEQWPAFLDWCERRLNELCDEEPDAK